MSVKSRTFLWPPAALCAEAAAYHMGQLSVGTFLAEVAAGRFPPPIWVTEGRKAWRTADLDALLDARAGRLPQSVADPAAAARAAADEWDLALSGARGPALS
jgi:predicted DNA-binding transcriptional regulator AlpA